VGFFAFGGLAVTLLRSAARSLVTSPAAHITTISLTAPATLTDTKTAIAPTTKYRYQLQNPALKITGRSIKMGCILSFRFA
jgi:hypothetical protein